MNKAKHLQYNEIFHQWECIHRNGRNKIVTEIPENKIVHVIYFKTKEIKNK